MKHQGCWWQHLNGRSISDVGSSIEMDEVFEMDEALEMLVAAFKWMKYLVMLVAVSKWMKHILLR